MNRKQRRKYESQHPINANADSLHTSPEQLPAEFQKLMQSYTTPAVNSPLLGAYDMKSRTMSSKNANNLMYCMLGLPAKVLVESKQYTDEEIHDIINHIIDEHDAVFDDYLTYDDIQNVVWEEGGVNLDEIAGQCGVNVHEASIQNFLIVIAVAVMTMMDKVDYDTKQLEDFSKQLIHEYKYYQRGFITNYQLKEVLKKHADVIVELKEEES